MDVNNVAILGLRREEHGKDFGFISGDHYKASVHNLFTNFKKSHMLTISHMNNWCHYKGLWFEDHSQSEASKGKCIVITPQDHKRVVLKGIQILDDFNKDIDTENMTFIVIKDLQSEDVCSFWFKVKCVFYSKYFLLYPSKKNLKSNLKNHTNRLKNHTNRLKHLKAIDDNLAKAVRGVVLSGRLGQPSKSAISLDAN